MAYSQRWASERWPVVPPDSDEELPRSGRPRDEYDDWSDEPHRYAERPVVNPYAIVALVAALILIFPVAIVFGLIAFGHPRGRFMAFTAILLGVLEVALLAALVLLPREGSGGMFARVGDAVGRVTGERETVSAGSAAPETSAPARSVVPTKSPAATEPAAPRGGAAATPPAAEADTPCPEPALLGTATDGGTLLCLTDTGSITGYQWSGPYRVADTVRAEGAACTGAVTARTAAGYALVCERGAWALWTS